MKSTFLKLFILAVFAVSTAAISAQTKTAKATATADDYKAHQDGWLVNLDEAYELSKETGKPIMANFTGSDWCGWCKRLSANVFVHDEFKRWANENVILLELDYPRRFKIPAKYQAQNANLQKAFQVRGFPTIWVFNLDRDEQLNQFSIEALGKTGYTKTVQEFTSGVEKMINRTEGE